MSEFFFAMEHFMQIVQSLKTSLHTTAIYKKIHGTSPDSEPFSMSKRFYTPNSGYVEKRSSLKPGIPEVTKNLLSLLCSGPY